MQMQVTEEMWRSIGASIPEILLRLDPAGTILYVNRTPSEVPPEELVGDSVFRYMPLASEARVRGALEAIFERGEMQSIELPITLRDGRVRWVCASAGPLREDGRVVAATVLARDITSWKGAEFALRQLERQIQQFQKLDSLGHIAGGIAHDFSNILMVIKSAVDMLLPALPTGSDEHQDALAIRVAADRGTQLTRQILTLARAGDPRPEPLDLDDTVTHVCRMLGRLLAPLVTIRTELAAAGARVLAEPGQLDQVLENLIVNARDAMPDGGVVTVATRVDPDAHEMTLTVTDTGTGMPDTILRRILEPFFTTKPGRGTGLGLSTVSMIVRQLGGRLTVTSEVGTGTTFAIVLPRAERGGV